MAGDELPEAMRSAALVLRRPRSDFGDDVLAEHYSRAHS